jgi:hypothetical protein
MDNMARALCMLDNRLQSHTQNMYYLLLFHGNNGYAKASQCYVIRSLPASLFSNGAYCCTLLAVLVLTMHIFRVCLCSKVYLILTGVSWPT